jgi:hypothetical protein
MYRRLYASLAALIALPLAAGGCTQMMRHSNMIVFGTNTVVGLRVGTGATQVPSIELGYARQEAVLMPVVANTSTKTTTTTSTGNPAGTTTVSQATTLAPCDISKPVEVVAGQPAPGAQPLPKFVTHPCLLVASNDKEGAKDSYSVLASFGADFGAGAEPSSATARGGLAQYFATGMAAQLLALNGGAAVVAAGPAAEKAAEGTRMTLGGVSVTADQVRAGTASNTAYNQWIGGISTQIAKAADMNAFGLEKGKFETALGKTEPLSCTTVAECAKKAVANKWHFSDFDAQDMAKMNQAAQAGWPSYTPGD